MKRRTALAALLAAGANITILPFAQARGAPPPSEGRLEPAFSVNINAAKESELVLLPGVGPSRAQAIIARRTKRPFKRPREIMQIRGIGPKTYERLRPHLRVEGPALVIRNPT